MKLNIKSASSKAKYVLLFSVIVFYIAISHGVSLEEHYLYNFIEYDFYLNSDKYRGSLISLQEASLGTKLFTIFMGGRRASRNDCAGCSHAAAGWVQREFA